MPSWRTLIEKDHLGAWDLMGPDDKPRDFTLTIAKVESNVLKTRGDSKGKRKAVITFEKAKKKFVANTTNCETISALFGTEDYVHWIGKRITLYSTDVPNPKKNKPGQPAMVRGIRVRPRVPDGPAETLPDRAVDQAMADQNATAFANADSEDDDGK